MVIDPYTGVRLKPHGLYGGEAFNSLGCRGKEFEKSAAIKVLCLGDSTVFGIGLDDHNDTFPTKLEKMLEEYRQNKGLSGDVEVLNGGVPSFCLYQCLQLYGHYLSKECKFDYIIATFGWNDTPGGAIDLKFVLKEPPLRNKVLARIHRFGSRFRLYDVIANHFRHEYHNLPKSRRKRANFQFEIYLRQLVDLAQRNGAKIVLMPVFVQASDTEMDDYNAITRNVAKELNVTFIESVQPAFDDKSNKVGWIDRWHYDANGHTVVAQQLVNEYFKKEF